MADIRHPPDLGVLFITPNTDSNDPAGTSFIFPKYPEMNPAFFSLFRS